MVTYHWQNETLHGDDALNARIDTVYDDIRTRSDSIEAITWDGCHKIYVCLTPQAVTQMRDYGYDEGDFITKADVATPHGLVTHLQDWYDNSCGLRFIQEVTGTGGDTDYRDLIPQIFTS